MNNKRYLFLFGLFVLALAVGGCGSSSSSNSSGSSGGTVTLSGTVAILSSSKVKGMQRADSENYMVHVLNTETGEQKTATVDSSGNFSLTVADNSHYMISIIDSDKNYVGSLATGSVSNSTIPVALITGSDQSITNLGTVTANATTGKVTSDQTLNADTAQLAYSADGTKIAGGKTGEGSTDYTTTVSATACTSGTITCPDLDHDGVPDIFDTDNDNNTYADDIDGLVDKCLPGTVKFYIENYPTCTGSTCAQMNFPTPTEIDQNIGQLSMYTINLEFTPATGSSVSDFEYIQVTTPAYIDLYGYVYNEPLGSECFNDVLWTNCNNKKLKNYTSDPTKFKIKVAEPPSVGKGHILENVNVGDTFIFTIRKTDGTTHTCTRKVNIIPKYYPYALKNGSSAIDTNNTVTSWPLSTTLNWSLASATSGSRPKGMTYQVKVYPYSSSGGNCSFNAGNATVYATGQDITSAVINTTTLPSSSISMWGLELWATDTAGDETHVGPFSFTTDASKPCN